MQREAAGAFRAETFATNDVADGIRRATDWLRTAPPARRELVVISDFQLGALDAATFRDLPAARRHPPRADIGRACHAYGRRSTTHAARDCEHVARRPRAFTLRSPRVTLNSNETAVTWTDAASPIEIVGIDDDVRRRPLPLKRAATRGEITLRPFDLKLRDSAADRPFLLAAAEAVLAQASLSLPAPGLDGQDHHRRRIDRRSSGECRRPHSPPLGSPMSSARSPPTPRYPAPPAADNDLSVERCARALDCADARCRRQTRGCLRQRTARAGIGGCWCGRASPRLTKRRPC